ncbi:MAG: hypothetical protein HZC40_23745 [Chloroflexi bacterium]|nr:hypothetical protein [Chloroflexota bacterium]
MEDFQQENFQIATIVVVIAIILICMGYLLVFVNPQIALNPFKPPLPTRTPIAALPPTWTPTPTNTPTNTPTPTPTETPTSTPTVTPIPTETVIPTATRRPATATRRPPTAIPAPSFTYQTFLIECKHSGGTYIEGYVTNAGGEEAGVRVRFGSAAGSNEIETQITGSNRSPGYYLFVLNANGSRPGTYYVWVVDANGKAISDPNAGRVTTNTIRNSDDPSACWRAVVSFGRR